MSISASKSLSAKASDEPMERMHFDPTSAKDPPKRSRIPQHMGMLFLFLWVNSFPEHDEISTSSFFWSGSVHHCHHCLPTSTRDVTLEHELQGFLTSTNLARLASRISSARFLLSCCFENYHPNSFPIVIQRASQLEGLVHWGKGKADSHSFLFASLIKHSPKSFRSTKPQQELVNSELIELWILERFLCKKCLIIG